MASVAMLARLALGVISELLIRYEEEFTPSSRPTHGITARGREFHRQLQAGARSGRFSRGGVARAR